MIYVTHAQEEAMTLGDRIAVMNRGKVHQIDDPDTIYSRPTNLFVARFIGNPDMNFFDGSVQPSSDGLHVETDTFGFTLNSVPDGATERDVKVGIRSEDFHNPSLTALESEQTLTITANVQLIEKLGDHVNLHLERESTEFIANFDSTNADVGDTIDVILDLPQLHYFDQDTGERIGKMDMFREPAEPPSAE